MTSTRDTVAAICAGTGSAKHKVDLFVAAAKGRLPSGAIRSTSLMENVLPEVDPLIRLARPPVTRSIYVRPIRESFDPLDVHDGKSLVAAIFE